MTSSARPDNVSGIVSPSVFAVFRLMTSWTFTTCWTGRSAGLAEDVDKIRSVTHQPAGYDELAPHVDRGHRVAGR
jgi:hypothetical protein